jgi:hypothetical protein
VFSFTRKEDNHGKSVRIVGILAEFRTEHLPNTSLQHYRYAIQLDNFDGSMKWKYKIKLSVRLIKNTDMKTYKTYMPRVGFEPTIPVSERAKTVHALNGAATVISNGDIAPCINFGIR